MNVYCFNPDNDLALACGSGNYTPTRFAQAIARDLQLLPCWLASPGDCVLCDDTSLQSWVDDRGLGVTLIDHSQLAALPYDATLRPWGWNMTLRQQYAQNGVDEKLLPSPEQIEHIRQLSHRRTTIAIHQALSEHYCPTPVELDSLDNILAFTAKYPGCFVKEPWSGSGHGIYRAIDPDAQDLRQRCAGALKRQGSMLCEVAFDRTLDFAVEMQCENGEAQVIGFSVFESDFHLQYQHGIVDTAQALHDLIVERYPDFDLVVEDVRQALVRLIAPHYNGLLGVDMLLYRKADGFTGINPCVELNLRTTMGHVTAALGERHAMRGQFAIKAREDLKPDDLPLTPCRQGTKLVATLFPNQQ